MNAFWKWMVEKEFDDILKLIPILFEHIVNYNTNDPREFEYDEELTDE